MTVFKKIMFVLLGLLIAVGIFCVVVGIGCAINGVTFTQQIADWFGSNAVEVIEEATEVASMIKPVI